MFYSRLVGLIAAQALSLVIIITLKSHQEKFNPLPHFSD